MKKTNIVNWGRGHKKHFKNYIKAYNFAYNKAFYFDTHLNGREFKRIF